MRHIPVVLTCSRFVFGPVLLGLVWEHASSIWILTVLILSLLSDIFDGVIARRLKTVTSSSRVLDGRADLWLFTFVGASMWIQNPDLVRKYELPILIEVVLQLASYGFDLVRYGQVASLHAYSAKLWGFTLYLAAIGALVFQTGAFIWVAFVCGIISVIDAFAIKLLLPKWQTDVLSAFHARKLRKSLL